LVPQILRHKGAIGQLFQTSIQIPVRWLRHLKYQFSNFFTMGWPLARPIQSTGRTPKFKFHFLITAIEIADELLQIGCDQVLNIDYSYPLVKHMTDKTAKDYNPKLEYLCMDVRKMDLQNEVFDIVLDKGTFDCMMCADTSQKHMKEYMSQIFRVLCEGGSYIMVSYGEPPSREKYLRLVRFFSV
jgi:hypothetical protein